MVNTTHDTTLKQNLNDNMSNPYTNEEFQSKLLLRHNGEVITNDRYINATKLLFSCINNHSWLANPSNIIKIRGTGCPICAPRKLSLSQEEFQQKLLDVHDGFITCTDTYINKRTKITFKCIDGHSWQAEPGNIIHGKEGCPVCNKLINPNRPYYLYDNCYLLSIEGTNTLFYKIGISSNITKRIFATRKELPNYTVKLIHCVCGTSDIVTKLENKILSSFILENNPPNFGGYTEVLSPSNNKESLIEAINSIL